MAAPAQTSRGPGKKRQIVPGSILGKADTKRSDMSGRREQRTTFVSNAKDQSPLSEDNRLPNKGTMVSTRKVKGGTAMHKAQASAYVSPHKKTQQ